MFIPDPYRPLHTLASPEEIWLYDIARLEKLVEQYKQSVQYRAIQVKCFSKKEAMRFKDYMAKHHPEIEFLTSWWVFSPRVDKAKGKGKYERHRNVMEALLPPARSGR